MLVPSGDWSSLNTAIKAGADSVYFGIKGINMRHAARNFDILELTKIMDLLHKNGKKGYLTLNVLIYDDELEKVRNILKKAKAAGVDAVILWDFAVLSIAKELDIDIHLSTQAGVSNYEALKAYSDMGVKRAVLAREVDLAGISEIKRKIKENEVNCDIETFIHGAMCVSVSGRCFLSQYTFNKSANRGQCLQPCRREFNIIDKDNESEYVVGTDYLLSPKDLCSIDFIDMLIEKEIDAFKIEGRMRPPEYVKVVTGVYRTAIDAFFDGNFTGRLKEQLKNRLHNSFNRGFDSGFYFGVPKEMGGEVKREYKKIYLGEVKKYYHKIGVCEIWLQTSSLNKGQTILFSGDKTPADFVLVKEMQVDHNSVEKVEKGMIAAVKVPFKVRKNDKIFLWEEKPI